MVQVDRINHVAPGSMRQMVAMCLPGMEQMRVMVSRHLANDCLSAGS